MRPTHKFVDDVTLTEVLPSAAIPSAMQHSLSELHSWASSNFMQSNQNKTKEMTLGPVARRTLDPLVVEGNYINSNNIAFDIAILKVTFSAN